MTITAPPVKSGGAAFTSKEDAMNGNTSNILVTERNYSKTYRVAVDDVFAQVKCANKPTILAPCQQLSKPRILTMRGFFFA